MSADKSQDIVIANICPSSSRAHGEPLAFTTEAISQRIQASKPTIKSVVMIIEEKATPTNNVFASVTRPTVGALPRNGLGLQRVGEFAIPQLWKSWSHNIARQMTSSV